MANLRLNLVQFINVVICLTTADAFPALNCPFKSFLYIAINREFPCFALTTERMKNTIWGIDMIIFQGLLFSFLKM
jgi:hypothetical protein